LLWLVQTVDFVNNAVCFDALELVKEVLGRVDGVGHSFVWDELEFEWEHWFLFLSIGSVSGEV